MSEYCGIDYEIWVAVPNQPFTLAATSRCHRKEYEQGLRSNLHDLADFVRRQYLCGQRKWLICFSVERQKISSR